MVHMVQQNVNNIISNFLITYFVNSVSTAIQIWPDLLDFNSSWWCVENWRFFQF